MRKASRQVATLLAAWRWDIGSEPFRHAAELERAADHWCAEQRFLHSLQLLLDAVNAPEQ